MLSQWVMKRAGHRGDVVKGKLPFFKLCLELKNVLCAPYTQTYGSSPIQPLSIIGQQGSHCKCVAVTVSGWATVGHRSEFSSPICSWIDFSNDFLIDKYFMYSHIKNILLSLLFTKIIGVRGESV